jgi:hypothetical protein
MARARWSFGAKGRRWLLLGALVVVGIGWLVRHELTARGGPSDTPCQATVAGKIVRLDPEQARNATTIAAVGKQFGLPDHAVTVALATALQESQLHNLPGGDRDSLGLFQQRPSQGWGAPADIMRPSHAAASFYRHLTDVPNWESLSLTQAAQAVQRSALPDGYAQWDPPARLLARALTGELGAAFACRSAPPTSPLNTAALASAIQRELGAPGIGQAVEPAHGWLIASWLIGHASDYGIKAVTFDGHRWSGDSGTWSFRQGIGLTVSVE